MKTYRSGAAVVIVLAVIAVLGGAVMAFKPKFLHGDSKRAAASTQTTEELIAAQKKLSSVAAASVQKIGEANAVAPESPVKEFIAREVPVAMASLEKPDQTALLEAERRKNAVLSGKIEMAEKLYGDAYKRADEAQKVATAAIAAKRASDLELERVAAERLAAERSQNRWIIVACVCGALYLYTKFTHVGPGALAEAVSDMRKQGATKGIAALDGITTRFQQSMVRFINRVKDHPNPEPTPPTNVQERTAS